jgi:L-ascorbate metabolism protein UlaG (beta-lactamase superfamily)
MRITKLGHSCVRLEKDGAVLVTDPGVWTDAALAGAAAVMITHEHADHLDAEVACRAEDQDARLSRGRGGSPGSRRGPRT